MSEKGIEQICPGERPGYRRDLKRAMRRRDRREKRELIERTTKDDGQPEKPPRRRFHGYSIGLLLALAAPLVAQEPPAPTWPPPVEEPAEEPDAAEPEPAAIGPYLSAAGWCSLRSGEAAEDAPGCEAGIAAALYSRRLGESEYHVSAVAIIGESSVGAGVAWCRGRTCAGVGVVAVRDDAGIDTSTLAPAVGATWRPGR